MGFGRLCHGCHFIVSHVMTSPVVYVHTAREANNDQCHGIRTGYKGIKDKEQKVFVIANTDAVVDPVIIRTRSDKPNV